MEENHVSFQELESKKYPEAFNRIWNDHCYEIDKGLWTILFIFLKKVFKTKKENLVLKKFREM